MAPTPAKKPSTRDKGTTARTPAADARVVATPASVDRALALAAHLSGLLLAVLVAGWLVSLTMADGGVSRLGFAYMAGRWSNPLWQSWDLLLVWLGLTHGARVAFSALDDWVGDAVRRMWWKFLVAAVTLAGLALGTVAILTFDPNLT